MIEINCTQTQYKILIDTLSYADLYKGKCFLRKDFLTCPHIDKPNNPCKDCLSAHIRRIDSKQKR